MEEKKKASSEIKYEIINELGVIPAEKGSMRLELNRISWSGNEPKYDLRRWSPNRDKMGKGVTMSEKELIALYELLKEEVAFLRSPDA